MSKFIVAIVALVACAFLCAAQEPIEYSFNQTAETQPSGTNLQNNFYGWTMSMDWNASYLVVGAPLASVTFPDFNGKIYVYSSTGVLGTPTLGWSTPQIIPNPELENYAFFGQYVWVGLDDANNALVAAYAIRQNREGGVYLFSRSNVSGTFTNNTGYARPWKLGPFYPGAPYRFGESMAGDLRSNQLIIGSFRYNAKQGQAYTYEFSGSTWVNSTILNLPASDVASNVGFAYSLSLDGDYLAVGACGYGLNRGRAYIYQVSTGFELVTPVDPNDGAIGDQFGFSVALHNDTLVVGANRREDCGVACGAGYVFMQNIQAPGVPGNNTWGQLLKLTRPDPQAGEQFGYSVAINGNFMVVGSPSRDYNSSTTVIDSSGYVSVFQQDTGEDGFYSEDGWGQVGAFIHNNASARDSLGRCVAALSPHLVATAMQVAETTTYPNAGAAFTFFGNNMPLNGLTGEPPVSPDNNSTSTTSASTSGSDGAVTAEIQVDSAASMEWVFV